MKTVLHTTAAGGVIIDRDKVLVISSENRAAIGFPKGAIEKSESIEAAAIREIKEETGYNVVILEGLGTSTYEFDWKDGNRYRKTEHNFLMELSDDVEPVPDLQPGEDFENMWLSFDEARQRLTYKESVITLEKALTAYASRNT